MCVYTHLHPFTSHRHLGHIHVSTVVNNATVNTGVQMPLQDGGFILFRETPRSGASGPCGSSRLNFLSTLHTVVHSGHTSLQSHQQAWGSLSPTSSPALLCSVFFLFFLKVAILVGASWWFRFVFPSQYVEYLFLCLFTIKYIFDLNFTCFFLLKILSVATRKMSEETHDRHLCGGTSHCSSHWGHIVP